MIITDVEALLLRQPGGVDTTIADGSQDALVIRVTTDAGVVGMGEVDSNPTVVKSIIEAPASHKTSCGLRSLLVGQDPSDIPALWQRMYRGSLYYGRRGAAVHAISGVDIALWDIAGQVQGKPIHALLGGQRRERVRAYASALMPETADDVHRVVEAQLQAGFRAVKLGWGPLGQDAERDIALVRAARQALGDDHDLMIDIGKGWAGLGDAIDRARRMAEFRPYWIEEPFMPDDYASYRALAKAVKTPIAAGEEESTLPDFERLVDSGAVTVVQPDVTRAGGITETMRIAGMAFGRGKRPVLHAWSTGIIKAASLHVLAAMEHAEYFEYCVQTTELNQRLVAEKFPVADGYVDIPQKPGLGVHIDQDVLEECLVKGTQ
jgi:L-alanine-DL-glutamate epimerase-like enolase superfamily enzyme